MTAQTPTRTLQDVLDSVPNLVDYLYSNRKGSVLKDAVLRQPTEFVAPEFTTWRDEQRAWREGIAFYDQSFHMTTTYLRGPDAQKLLSSLAVNSFETFGVGRSRHFVVLQSRRLPHRRRDPLQRRPRGAGAGGSGGRPQLGAVLRRDRRLGCVHRGRRDLLPQSRRPAHRVPVSGGRARTRRRSSNSSPVLRCPTRRGRRSSLSPSPAITSGPSGTRWRATRGASSSGPWDEGPAVKEAILKAGAAVQPAPGRVARLLHQRAGAGLDPTAGAGHLHRRRAAPVPRVAAGDQRARRPGRSAAASMHPTSRTTTSRRGSSGTAT